MAVISLFVSSTFSDFNVERDLLQGPVLDALNEHARPYGATVEIVDLRWGVATHELESEAAQRKVLDVCFGEIERCQPFFIGLLGDRFGWVPDENTLRRALDHYQVDRVRVAESLDATANDVSITSLEFQQGLFGRTDAESLCFIREWAESPDAPYWTDPDLSRVQRLKSMVMRALPPERVQVYVVRDKPASVHHRQTFESAAIATIWHAIERHLQRTQAGSTVNVRDAVWAAFVEQSHRTFVGRQAILDSIVSAVSAGGGVVLLGPSGVGKSALWVHALERLAASFDKTATVSVGLVAEESTTTGVARSLASALGAELDGLDSSRDLMSTWVSVVKSCTSPALIAIDAVNNLYDAEGDNPLQLLTRIVGDANVAVLATTTLPDQAEVLRALGLAVVTIGDLDVAEVAEMAIGLCHPRELPTVAVLELAARPRSPLWVALAVRDLVLIDSGALAPAQQSTEPSAAITALLEATAGNLPDDVTDLARRLFDRCVERVIGLGEEPTVAATAVQQIVGVLAIAHQGARSSDLSAQGVTQGNALTTAAVVRTLGPFLRQVGSDGEVALAHDVLRRAAIAWCTAAETELHASFARYLLSLPHDDSLRARSVMWHSACSGDARLLEQAASSLMPSLDAAWTERCRRAASQLLDALQSVESHRRVSARMALHGLSMTTAAEVPLFLSRTSRSSTARAGGREAADVLTLTASRWALDHQSMALDAMAHATLASIHISRAQYLADRAAWMECDLPLEKADAELGLAMKASDATSNQMIALMFDLQEVFARGERARGHWMRATMKNNTANLLVTAARSKGTFDESLAGRQADSYLMMAETMLHGGAFALAADAIGAARNELNRIEIDESSPVTAKHWSRVGIVVSCLRLFGAVPPEGMLEVLSSVEAGLEAQLRVTPWNLDFLRLQQEVRYYTGLAQWRQPAGRQSIVDSVDAHQQLIDCDGAMNKQHFLRCAAHLNLADFARAVDKMTLYDHHIDELLRVTTLISATEVERADVVAMAKTYVGNRMIIAKPSDVSARRWNKSVSKALDGDTSRVSGIPQVQPLIAVLERLRSVAPDPSLPRRTRHQARFLDAHVIALNV